MTRYDSNCPSYGNYMAMALREDPPMKDTQQPGRTTARDKAIDVAMREMYGSHGPDEDIDADAIRRILGAVFDAGTKARSTR
jgi:hypothetical protein